MYKFLIFGISLLILQGCGRQFIQNTPAPQPEPGPEPAPVVAILDPTGFATKYSVPYSSASTSPNQTDTLCVDVTTANLTQLRANMDSEAQAVGASIPSVLFWYNQFKLNDQDYVTNCLGTFPKTFTSMRTGNTYTVHNNTECRAATSDLAATDYMNFITNGGQPVKISAKLKTSGCAGGVAPYVGRIQSVDGSFTDDFHAIPH